MKQYSSLGVKLSNSQLNKLKSALKNETGVVLRLLLNIVGDAETNFPHKLLLTDRQVENLRKALANKSSTDIDLSKTQLSGGFFGRILGPLLKIGLPKSVLIPLGLAAAASAADSGIHKKILGPGKRSSNPKTTALIMSNDEMKDIIEIAKCLEDSGLLLIGVSETIENEAKEQKGGFLSMLLGTVGASLLGRARARARSK